METVFDIPPVRNTETVAELEAYESNLKQLSNSIQEDVSTAVLKSQKQLEQE